MVEFTEVQKNYLKIVSRNQNTEFVVGVDDFADLTINEAPQIDRFFYFQNSKKGLVTNFVLKRTQQSEKVCVVTLIKNTEGVFEPRFEFLINDRTKKAVESVMVSANEVSEKLLKARVNLDDCHEELSQLMSFVRGVDGVEFAAEKYAVVSSEKKQLVDVIEASGKENVITAFAQKYGNQVTEKDITIITRRKQTLSQFHMLLTDPEYFAQCQEALKLKGKGSRPEDVWQQFFEINTWIFGYGLQLVASEALDDRKLETIVVGADLFDGAGKRIDGLLKTKSSVSKFLFAEIKRHDTPLLEEYDRPGVYAPAKHLRGAVAQIQKTIHKVNLKVSEVITVVRDKDGEPTGEQIAFVKPNAVVVVGRLSEFSNDKGVNDQKLASFELYRQGLHGVEVITFDELYERTKFIVEA